MTKTIFWNVDTENDFMKSDGALYVAGAEGILLPLMRATLYATEHGIQVVNTADRHYRNSKEISDTPDFKTTFPPHCLRGTKGAEFIPETKPEDPYVINWEDADFDREKVRSARNIVLYKDAFDIFAGSPHADEVLNVIAPDRAVVYGVATNVCVNYAVLGLLKRGVDVYVLKDAIKELPTLPLEETLNAWKKAGARLIDTTRLDDITTED